ncbi:MAG: ABC transporter substrate-binding protein [Anaerolineaceae bacterium]|nr:ABC transporter substrate-binding protein [Anaerolineaceae bacterium]
MMKKLSILFFTALICCLFVSACADKQNTAVVPEQKTEEESETLGKSSYFSFPGDEPNTLDPQCTSEHYNVPLNVFDRLVEVKTVDGENRLVPSLAESWVVSEDGLVYTFTLREGVKFSNGSPLTSGDVKFSMERLLTHPRSRNQDIAVSIVGADQLRAKDAEHLEGFRVIDDLNFEITLQYPYGPFLACLSTPGASILDEETVRAAGDKFGIDVQQTVGTGPFVLEEWKAGSEITMAKNRNFWGEPAKCDGLRMIFLSGRVSPLTLFQEGVLDILDLELLGSEKEYLLHGDIYQSLIVSGPRVGITYLAMNETAPQLRDVRVRKALQLALDRHAIMNAMINGQGYVENGIFPHGLIGFNPDLPEIPFDVEQAKQLLAEAGFPDGFELDVYYPENSAKNSKSLCEIISYMWEKIGVTMNIMEVDDTYFVNIRQHGKLPAYISTWSADFDDPDNFIYTFFGTPENTFARSLFYRNSDVIKRVRKARAIVDHDERMAEYQELERIIVQEDAAWIPLYSAQHNFVVGKRVKGFEVSWNGWSSTRYQNVSVD